MGIPRLFFILGFGWVVPLAMGVYCQWRRWRGRLLVFLAGSSWIVVSYIIVWQPFWRIRDLRSCKRPDERAIRSTYHRMLIWDTDPHDPFLILARYGDETSVPYIIWALRNMPNTGLRVRTWGHGMEALSAITNNSPGNTRQAWHDWYAGNKYKSRLERSTHSTSTRASGSSSEPALPRPPPGARIHAP
jgi:hypothetical protein